jgi:hypothetical protein
MMLSISMFSASMLSQDQFSRLEEEEGRSSNRVPLQPQSRKILRGHFLRPVMVCARKSPDNENLLLLTAGDEMTEAIRKLFLEVLTSSSNFQRRLSVLQVIPTQEGEW